MIAYKSKAYRKEVAMQVTVKTAVIDSLVFFQLVMCKSSGVAFLFAE